MQRIYEEKAWRIMHCALMKDRQCVWEQMREWNQVATESRKGPKCEINLQFLSEARISNDFCLTFLR